LLKWSLGAKALMVRRWLRLGTLLDRKPGLVNALCWRLDSASESGHIAGSGMPEPRPPEDPSQEDDLRVAERTRSKRPRRYQVVLHNDDYTTMEFVVEVLMRFFQKDITEARHIMLHVHHKGYGVVDVFPRDVAETKAEQVMDFAKEHGHPLRCTAEPEDGDEPEED
jgi:ATP-dependent Clp protease adaptor protein ClpS